MDDKKQAGILKGIQLVMDELGAIGKTKYNSQQGFNFRGIDDVMNTLHPLLAKAHIFIVPSVEELRREERQTSRGGNLIYTLIKTSYQFICTDDFSEITATVFGEGMDSGDKSLNKAMSIALKYALFQVFCIPTEEMPDPDAESHRVAPKQQYPQEFLDACHTKAGGSTLGKLRKTNRPLYDNLKATGTPEEKAAIEIIEKYAEDKTA